MDLLLSPNRTDDGILPFCNESGSTTSKQTLFLSLSCVLMGFLSVLITFGNLLVIMSIIYFKQLHTPTNFLVLSLAVADMLVGVFIIPFSIVLSGSSCWSIRGKICKIRSAFDSFLSISSVLNLCSISVDRYFAVCQPLSYKAKITVRVSGIMILVTWTFAALISLMITVPAHIQCKLFQNSKTTVVGAFVGFYIPTIVILSLYMKVLAVARRQVLSIQSTKSGVTLNRMEKKATKTLAFVVGVFLVCWTPFIISISCHPLTNYSVPDLVLDTLKWLTWLNSMLNPFIYAFFYSWFRKCFKIIVYGKIFLTDYSKFKLF